jgi:hypothetical protein
MIIENSIESYILTCMVCGARWTESYQVSQSVDEEGAIRAFYRRGGTPCEAPAGENVECPRCHSVRARRDPVYGSAEDADVADVTLVLPGQRAGENDWPGPVRTAGHTWRRFRFSAVVTLDGAGRFRRQYLSDASGLVLRVASCTQPTLRQYFPALVHTEEGRPLRPGDKAVPATVSVPDDDASSFFQPGQHFTVWDGTDIGHGTVKMRLFFGWWP